MITVIKPGKLPGDEVYRGACYYCHCEFTFQSADALRRESHRNEQFFVIPCPKCKRETFCEY